MDRKGEGGKTYETIWKAFKLYWKNFMSDLGGNKVVDSEIYLMKV